MKKYGMHLLWLLLILPMAFTSCTEEDDDEDVYTIGDEYNGTYLGQLAITANDGTASFAKQKIFLVKNQKDERVDLEIKNLNISATQRINFLLNDVVATTDQEGGKLTLFYSDIKEIDNDETMLSYTLTINGTVDKGVMSLKAEFTWDIEDNGLLPKEFSFNGNFEETPTSSSAAIESIQLSSEFFHEQATFTGANQTIYIGLKNGVTSEQLQAAVVDLSISLGATVTPPSGTLVNLNEPVVYKVTSQDGVVTNEFTIRILERPTTMTFDDWDIANPTDPAGQQYYNPVTNNELFQWSSLNGAISNYMNKPTTHPEGESNAPLKPADHFGVRPTSDAVSGQAVQITSLKGNPQPLYEIPVLIASALYTGTYTHNLNTPAESMRFGIPLFYEPISIRGYYKYTPGSQLYQALPAQPYKMEAIDGTDAFSIEAVLYTVDDPFDDSEMLTYEALQNSNKVVARAQLTNSTIQNNYVKFDLPLEYLQEYNYDNKYRIALFFTPSIAQDIYRMAPGSVLYLDDVEVVTK